MRIVEKPEDKELSFLFKKYGRPKFRSIHWDMRNKQERKDYEDCIGEAVLLIWKENKGLVAVRHKNAPENFWTIPMGRVWAGETIEKGAKREALEETGLEIEISGMPAVHIINIFFKDWQLERWYFIIRAKEKAGRLIQSGGEEVVEARYWKEFEIPPKWMESEWYSAILLDGGLSFRGSK